MGKLSEAWSRWFRTAAADSDTDGAKRRLLPLTEGQQGFARYLVLLGALGLILMLLGSPERGVRQTTAPPEPQAADTLAVVGAALGDSGNYAAHLERSLTEALSQMQGVGRVKVMVTLATGPETVFQESGTQEKRVSREEDSDGTTRVTTEERTTTQPVMTRMDGGRQEEPVARMERYPAIQGVLVVADGANHSLIRLQVTRAVGALLQIPAHRISVVPRG